MTILSDQFDLSTLTDEELDILESSIGKLSTIVDDNVKFQFLSKTNLTRTGNGRFFIRNTRGFMPALMDKYYTDRKLYKQKMIEAKKEFEKPNVDKQRLTNIISTFDNKQLAKKIQMNAFYGSQANKFFRWFKSEFAEAITSSGQLSTKWIERSLNVYLNKALSTVDKDYVIACDTDSVYIRLDGLVDQLFPIETQKQNRDKILKFMDKLCVDKIEPFIHDEFEKLAQYTNAFEQKMVMKRECIADKGIWTAKKRYILNVYNQEGVQYQQPKLKMMGIEAIRSSTPHVCREAIKKSLEVIMSGEEPDLQTFIRQFRNEFDQLPFETVASPRSVSELDSYYDHSSIFRKSTPINVKGALIYNHHIKALNLDKKYETIAPGQKIRYAYCVQPNPLGCSVIAIPTGGTLPPEFNMDNYIDRMKQYEKSFLAPIQTIANAIGWKVEQRATLQSLFGD